MAIISVVGGISDLSPADYRLNLRQEHAASFPAWTALAVGFWGWAYMKGQLERPSTLIRYTLWWRALPIVLIIIVLVVTTVTGSYIFEFCSRRQAELPNHTLVDTDQSSQALLGSDLVQIHETAQGGQQTGPRPGLAGSVSTRPNTLRNQRRAESTGPAASSCSCARAPCASVGTAAVCIIN